MKPFAELSQTELDGLIERVKQATEHGLALSGADLQLLLNALLMLAQLQEQMADHDITLHKLRKLAGIVSSSEKLSAVVPTSLPPKQKKTPARPPKPATERVIHERCQHKLNGLAKGQRCPECERGTLYQYDPAVVLRISGQTPLKSTQHILERLRCNTCGAYFTAALPDIVRADGPAEQAYGPPRLGGASARALMGIQKYFAGAPFYRQQTLQQLLGMPVGASTVFDQCEQLANALQPLFTCLLLLAGKAAHYGIDDTTNRILAQGPIQKPDRRTGKPKERSGVYTSVAIALRAEGQACVLYQTNVGHAGEWLDEILRSRPPTAPPVIMSDALSRNRPTVVKDYHQALCNAHARREFVDVAAHFPDQVAWVLERYALIWKHDHHCEAEEHSPAARLAYHRDHSLPVLEAIREWGQAQLASGAVEANSGLGQAIGYYTRHYEGLTAFCRWEGAPLDNNWAERELKLIIRGRNNALFFKTPAGAAIADVITSVVATALPSARQCLCLPGGASAPC
jgi:transposase